MRFSVISLMGAAALGLAACGGSSTGVEFVVPTPAPTADPKLDPQPVSSDNAYAFQTLSQFDAFSTQLANDLDASAPTRATDVAAQGSARHDGLFTIATGDNFVEGVLGNVRIETNLATGNFTGKANNFYALDESKATGELSIAGTRSVDNNGRLVTNSTINGSMDYGLGDVAFDGDGVGVISGPNGELDVALIDGNATYSDGSVSDFVGAWVAEEQ